MLPERPANFSDREKITFRNLLNPVFILKLLAKHGYIHFLTIGASGALLNLLFVWIFTEFFFGRLHYFRGYLIGLSVNVLYNFFLFNLIIFRAKSNHIKRFFLFSLYTLLMIFVQASAVKFITPIVGIDYYLPIIALTILFFSTFSFFFFKLYLFKEQPYE